MPITNDSDSTLSIAVGDVDGDGDLDVVAGNGVEHNAGIPDRLYLNNGTANPFANVNGTNISSDSDRIRSIALGDVDGDGHLDVVTGNLDTADFFHGHNRLYLNNGSSTSFVNVEGVNITNDSYRTFSIALGDVNGDGHLDVVAGNKSSQPNRLYLNNGTANPFANVEGINITTDLDNTYSIALGDVDGDGDLDVVAGNFFQPNRLYLNNGTANPFANVNGANISPDSDGTDSIALGDADGDGDLDVVAGNWGDNRFYLNNGTANPFANVHGANISPDSESTYSIALGDVDGDGHLDVVAGNRGDNRLYLNNGTNNPFANVMGLTIDPFHDRTRSIVLRDINGDNRMDIVTGNEGINHVVYPYVRLPKTPGDFQTHRGTVVSSILDDRLEPILSATLTGTADIPLNTNINFYLSNNGGQLWYPVRSGEPLVFPTNGSDLRWKAELHALSPAITPVLTSVSITGNSAPTDIVLSKSFIAENQGVGDVVGMFETVDIDGGPHTYSLVDGFGGEDNAVFLVEGDVLKANAVFDFESKQSYTMRVRVTDESGGYFEEQFTIGVSDANDPPTDISLSDSLVEENLPPRTTIGVLSAADIDVEDIHVFSLPTEVLDNALFAIDGIELKTNEIFDFEAQEQYQIQVRVTDGGGGTFEKDFTITIEDVNDTPTIQVISSPPEPRDDVGFGKNVTIEVFIKADDQDSVNGVTQFDFTSPTGELQTFDRQTAQGVTAPISFAPDSAGNWKVVVRWLGNDDIDSAETEIPFTVAQSGSILELFFLDVIQVVGQPRTIPGRLRISNQNPGKVDLAEREITITIHHPIHDFPLVFTEKTDSRGNFEVAIPEDFFDVVGEWEIEAEFAGDNDLGASDIGSDQVIIVRQKSGYAILVQGSVESEEGVAEHDNTLIFVRETFEDAGFDTNLADPDINVIPHNTPNPKDAFDDAIIEWAKEKINPAPAPLYVVLVNHGEVGAFHMHPDELTSEDLDGMLDTLQDGLTGLAKEQKVIVILGMCFSGSFIPAVSGENRIIITAAARDEFSIRGPGDEGERQGEQFVYQLFRELRKGESLLESFQTSRQAVRSLSADRTLAVNTVNPTFPGEKGQHPLLDDNGDGVGSTIVPDPLGDGEVAAGIALTSSVNALLGLEIARTNPTQFLPPIPEEDSEVVLPALWAEVDADPEEVLSMWMEVKRVDVDPGVDEDSTMQHALDLVKEPMDIGVNGGAVRAQWPRAGVGPNPSGLFLETGTYQVFTFASSTNDRSEVSEPAVSWVYRASGDSTPTEFALLEADADGIVDYNPATPVSSGLFTWGVSTSSAEPVTYVFRLWADESGMDIVYESEPLATTQTFLPPEAVEDGQSYYWDAVAVDRNGNTRFSEIRKVSIIIPNALPGFIFGKVTDADNGQLIENGEVNIDNVSPSVEIPLKQGFYLSTVTSGMFTLFARATNFSDSESQTVSVRSGEAKELNFQLKSDAPRFEFSITSEFGNPQGTGTYLSGTEVAWSVTSPWPNADGGDGIRYVVDGDKDGTIEIQDKDVELELSWKEEVFIKLETDGNGTVTTSEWFEQGSEVDITSTPFNNYEFDHWTGDIPARQEEENPLKLHVDQPRSIQATFKLVSHTVEVTAENGSVDGAGAYTHGTLATLMATPDNFYRFINWSGDGEGNANPLQVTVNNDLVIVAHFEPVTYTLTLVSEFGEPIGGGEYTGGEEVSWSVTSPWPGGLGERWVADSTNGQVVMDSDKTITINWTREWFLNVQSQSGGSVNVGSGWVVDTSVATLEASPADSFAFSRWSGDVPSEDATKNPLTLTMNQARSLTAVFTRTNSPPTAIQTIPNLTTTEGLLFSYSFPATTFSDLDGDALTYTAALSDGSPLPEWLSFSGETRTFIGTPSADNLGVLDIQLTATDPSAASAITEFSLTIQAVNDVSEENHPPVVDSTHVVVPKGLSVQGVLSASDIDTDDVLTFDVILQPVQGSVVLEDVHSGNFIYRANPDAGGSDSFSVVVNDGQVNSDPARGDDFDHR